MQKMACKRVRGWTSGRSLPVLNFVKKPPGPPCWQLHFCLILFYNTAIPPYLTPVPLTTVPDVACKAGVEGEGKEKKPAREARGRKGSLLLSYQYSSSRFYPFIPFLWPATQAIADATQHSIQGSVHPPWKVHSSYIFFSFLFLCHDCLITFLYNRI